jgi:GrpB-like predicted nucleotidyltransferase (UPF0157 family)
MDDRRRQPTSTPTTTERLQAVTVGQLTPLNASIDLHAYDPQWPSMYEKLRGQIRGALGDKALIVEHVGSTSVPGLSAKPVIDIVLAVADSADEPSYLPPLERLGYVLRIREPDWFEHRLLKAPVIEGNLHVFSHACEEIDRMLTFRDRLRTDAGDRNFYEHTKRDLAGRQWTYMQDYADAKSDVIRQILAKARRRA